MPSHINSVNLFDGEWASDLAEVLPDLAHAGTPMFYQDNRPRQAAEYLGENGSFAGKTILELGPLEGAHSYQLEKLGCENIVSIESNAEAFLRCLVVKNILSLKTTFLLGDCLEYLKNSERKYDLIFASGILYHMENPIDLIRLAAEKSNGIFIWTQYYSKSYRDRAGKSLDRTKRSYCQDGLSVDLYEIAYGNRFRADFFGGNAPKAVWLELDSIVLALKHFGFADVKVIKDDQSGERGPAATIVARRDASLSN